MISGEQVNPEPLGRGTAGHPTINCDDHPLSKVLGQHSFRPRGVISGAPHEPEPFPSDTASSAGNRAASGSQATTPRLGQPFASAIASRPSAKSAGSPRNLLTMSPCGLQGADGRQILMRTVTRLILSIGAVATVSATPAPMMPTASGAPVARGQGVLQVVSIKPCVDAVLVQVANHAQIAGISHYSQDPRAT